MKKPLISKESVRLLFDLGIEVLKSMKDIYETKTERKPTDEDTSQNTDRDSKEDINLDNRDNSAKQD
jgi:hypothetical protein